MRRQLGVEGVSSVTALLEDTLFSLFVAVHKMESM